MRYFIDTEFNEDGDADRPTITLISIALVAEDGRELYCINRDVKEEDCNAWVREHVFPNLYGSSMKGVPEDQHVTTLSDIRKRIEYFVGDDPKPEFWGYYCDYDWVVFCWLWGAMVNLPKHFPKYCIDLKQLMHELGIPAMSGPAELGRVPATIGGPEHNALSDARWNAAVYAKLEEGVLARKVEAGTGRFVKTYRYDPVKDPSARLRLDYDPEFGNAIFSDENVHPEQADNPDANHVEAIASMQLTMYQVRWLAEHVPELIARMERADAEANAYVEARRKERQP